MKKPYAIRCGSFANMGDGTVWPLPGDRLGQIEWDLRYSTHALKSELLVAASVISAYTALVNLPERRRRVVIRKLRALNQHCDV